jgi:transcriptional regulator with XRE-family HTH domain
MKDTIESRKIIGLRLALARQRAGLSQEQVAKKMQLPRPSISEIESGRRRVAVDEMLKFADLYQVDMNWLSGQGVEKANAMRDKLQLAARQVADLKSEDFEKVIDLLTSLKTKGKK